MELKIESNQLGTKGSNAFGQFKSLVGDWMGRLVTVLKAGNEKATVHLQDKRIAVVSLICMNLILFEIGVRISNYLDQFCDSQGIKRDILMISSRIGPIVIGVTAFSKYTKIPFRLPALVGISAVTVVGRIFISDIISDLIET